MTHLETGVIALVFIVVVVAACCAVSVPSKEDASIADHHLYGEWQVRYPDGQLSQPFHRETAREYANMFGGIVIRKRKK